MPSEEPPHTATGRCSQTTIEEPGSSQFSIRGLGGSYPAFGPQALLSAQPDRRPENPAHARRSLGQRHGLDPPSGREVDRGFRVEHVASLDNALRNVLFARQATCQADSAATPPGIKSRRLVAAGRTEAGHVARSANFRASSTVNTTQTVDLHSSPVSTPEFSAFSPITMGTSRQHSHTETPKYLF